MCIKYLFCFVLVLLFDFLYTFYYNKIMSWVEKEWNENGKVWRMWNLRPAYHDLTGKCERIGRIYILYTLLSPWQLSIVENTSGGGRWHWQPWAFLPGPLLPSANRGNPLSKRPNLSCSRRTFNRCLPALATARGT